MEHQGIEPGWRERVPSTTVPADQPDDPTASGLPEPIGKPIRQMSPARGSRMQRMVSVDPACNRVAGGRGRLCEIQAGDGTSAGMQATNLIPARTTLKLAADGGAAALPAWGKPAPVRQPARVRALPARPRSPEESMFQMAWSARR